MSIPSKEQIAEALASAMDDHDGFVIDGADWSAGDGAITLEGTTDDDVYFTAEVKVLEVNAF